MANSREAQQRLAHGRDSAALHPRRSRPRGARRQGWTFMQHGAIGMLLLQAVIGTSIGAVVLPAGVALYKKVDIAILGNIPALPFRKAICGLLWSPTSLMSLQDLVIDVTAAVAGAKGAALVLGRFVSFLIIVGTLSRMLPASLAQVIAISLGCSLDPSRTRVPP
jgi:hypothetical protein